MTTSDEEPLIECWNGEKKVTVYPTSVLCSWGSDIDLDMTNEPRTLESVDAAFRWLYSDAKPMTAEAWRAFSRNLDTFDKVGAKE